jgi:hypothetical protein
MATTQPYNYNTTSNSGIGAAAAPYAQDLLAQSHALISNDPYHAYTGQTVAGPVGLQQVAANSVAGLDAGNLATKAQALTEQGANYDPTTAEFDGAAADKYMNPYQQNVIDVTNREAGRSAAVQGTYDASKAAQAGAFGGSRQGIVDAERERNLATLQSDNQMKGSAAAFTNAQQQFNTDQQRQQQAGQFASQAALAGGNALTAQGGQAFGQQQVSGAQQQAQAQGDLTQAKANFDGAVAHPYNQLTFMNNQLKPMLGSSSTSSATYTPDNQAAIDASNSGIAKVGALAGGLGALGQLGSAASSIWGGLGSFFAKGGAVKSGLPEARIAQFYGSLKK